MVLDEKMAAAYDHALLGILQNETGLEAFLNVIFGFLARRTDFYYIMQSEKQNYGFPPGIAEKMIMTYFKKYQSKVLEMHSRAATADKEAKKETKQSQSENKTKQKDNENVTNSSSDMKSDNNTATSSSTIAQKDDENTKLKHVDNITTGDVATTSKAPACTVKEDDKQAVFQSNPDSYNGAIRENYSWSQNYDDVDVKIPVSKTVAKAKQVFVDIQRKHLKVCVKKSTSDVDFTPLVDGELPHEINREESMWSLEAGKHIDITLTKDKNIWWSALVTTEEEIDIQKICPERSMADMDQEEKAVINKLQFDDRQKKLGLPQSHELKVHEMLKKGWDAEGSPFKGQEFDPKMFNISPGAVDM